PTCTGPSARDFGSARRSDRCASTTAAGFTPTRATSADRTRRGAPFTSAWGSSSRRGMDAPVHPSRIRRLLVHTGVASLWTVGLVVFIVGLAFVGLVWLSRQPAGNRMTFALANRALARSTNLRLSAERSLIVEHGAALVAPTIE